MFRKRCLLLLCVFVTSLPVLAGVREEIAGLQKQVAAKQNQLDQIQSEIDRQTPGYNQALQRYDQSLKVAQERRNNYQKAKDALNRAQKNFDLVSSEQLAKLTEDLKSADREAKNAEEQLRIDESDKNIRAGQLKRLQEQKEQTTREILETQATIFDRTVKEPVWVEGYGEAILDENTTMKDCQKAALDRAIQDASAKGGLILVESVTVIESNRVVRDQLKSSIRVQVLEQDNSGDFGKVKRDIQGDVIKFSVRVRVKIQSMEYFNPYRSRLTELQGQPPQATPLPPGNKVEVSKGDFKTILFGDSKKTVDQKVKQLAKARELERTWLGDVYVRFLNKDAACYFYYFKDRLYRIDLKFGWYDETPDEIFMQNFLYQELIPCVEEMYGPAHKKYGFPRKDQIFENWITYLTEWDLPKKAVYVGITSSISRDYDKDKETIIRTTVSYRLSLLLIDKNLDAERLREEEAKKNQGKEQAKKFL